VTVSGAGTVKAEQDTGSTKASAAKKKRKKKPTIYLKPARVTVTKAGPVTLKLKPTSAAKKKLRKVSKLKVKIKITFQPAGLQPITRTTTVTLKAQKKKK
jgi:hypothetical protein